jgi:hypothetical protein
MLCESLFLTLKSYVFLTLVNITQFLALAFSIQEPFSGAEVVAHIYNSCYSEGKDGADRGSSPARAKLLTRLHFNQEVRHGGTCL